MKQALTVLLLITAIQFAFATDYYVSSSTGDDNNNGLSTGTPWETFTKIQNFSFAPGDQILLKKGDVWHQTFKLNSSGTVSQPITISSYGTGINPIIDVIAAYNNLNWTNAVLGSNIWSTPDVPYDPKRLLIDGVEVLDAAEDRDVELGTNIPDLVQWYYDDDAYILKIYSTVSPEYRDIRFSSELYGLSIADEHNINIENIEIIGGYRYCVALSSCSHITLTNLRVGKYANHGMLMGAYKVNGVNFQLCDSVIIDNCIIDTEYTFDYSQAGTASGVSNRGPREGVLFRGTTNCELKNSTVKNYCHANINIFAPATEPGGTQLDERVVQNCKIYNNIITSPDIAYGGRAAIDGFCFDNEIYNNLFVDIAVQNQFNGYNNHIHHNIFKGIKSSPLKTYTTGNAIALQGYYIEAFGNIFENNIMIDCESAGIYISGNNGYGDVTNNIFRNNIIYNCGIVDNYIGLAVATDTNTYSNYGNTLENNLVYNDNSTETILFYNTTMDVTSLNSENNTNDYSISNNIAANPMFLDVLNDDFHLQNTSPCIDSGITPLATVDMDGNSIPYPGTLPDIGIYEYQATLSVDDYLANSSFFIYPNPINNSLFIKNTSNEKIQAITVFDMTGKQIFRKTIGTKNSNQIELNVSEFKQGFYILKLNTSLHSYSKGIIKE